VRCGGGGKPNYFKKAVKSGRGVSLRKEKQKI